MKDKNAESLNDANERDLTGIPESGGYELTAEEVALWEYIAEPYSSPEARKALLSEDIVDLLVSTVPPTPLPPGLCDNLLTVSRKARRDREILVEEVEEPLAARGPGLMLPLLMGLVLGNARR